MNDLTLTDMFCGCGGSSQGATKVEGVRVAMAMNHWPLAVESHNTNHPDTDHDCADISDTNPLRYRPTDILIASPECTNHSIAKGQRRKNLMQGDFFNQNVIDPKAVRSRATMWDVPRFAEVHKYEVVIVENVVDVRMWVMYEAWIKAMRLLGYLHECVYLNAMFAHGEGVTGFAPQSRDRIYVVFWKKGNKKPDLNIRPKAPCPTCCAATESVQAWKNGRRAGKYRTQYIYRCSVCATEVTPYYYAALNCLDLSLPMTKISEREAHGKKPLQAKTLARIEYGLKKYGTRAQLHNLRNMSGGVAARVSSELEALSAQTTSHDHYLMLPFLFDMAFSHAAGARSRTLEDVLNTQTTQQSAAMVAMSNLTIQAGRDCSPLHNVLEGAVHTQTTAMQNYLLGLPGFISPQYSSASANFLTDPLPTQMCKNKSALVSTSSFIGSYYGSLQASSVLESLNAVTGNDRHFVTEPGKELRAEDCYFRMLQPHETKVAQGFPTDYVVLGNKSEQQKQIGNANPPPTMNLLVQRAKDSITSNVWV